MKFTINNINENTTKTIETPFTFKQWLSIHFGAWGFYKIEQIDKKHYKIYDSFTKELQYTITK